jgi:hypothetical protein
MKEHTVSSQQLRITLAGREHVVEAGTTAGAALGAEGSVVARMRQVVKQGQRFSRRVVTDAQAREGLAAEPYKPELIGLKGHPSDADGESVEVSSGVDAELTIYDNLDPASGEPCWKDLCRGPHLPTTRVRSTTATTGCRRRSGPRSGRRFRSC